MQHSPHCFQYSDSVILVQNTRLRSNKSVLTHTQVQHSAKFLQTTRVVCTDFSRSLYRLRLKSPKSTKYLQL